MLLRRIARPLLAGIFITSGVAALRDPEGHEKVARPVLDQINQLMPLTDPPSNVRLVQIDAGAKIGAGGLLALGVLPRLSAAVLATSLVPSTLAAHRYWEIDDAEQREIQRVHFLKNLGLLGGLLLAVSDTEGKPSLGWYARRKARKLSRAGYRMTEAAGRAGGRATGLAEHTSARLTDVVGGVASKAAGTASKAAGAASKTGGVIGGTVGSTVGGVASDVAARATGETHRLRADAEALAHRVAEEMNRRAARNRKRARRQARRRLARAQRHAALAQHQARLQAERVRVSALDALGR